MVDQSEVLPVASSNSTDLNLDFTEKKLFFCQNLVNFYENHLPAERKAEILARAKPDELYLIGMIHPTLVVDTTLACFIMTTQAIFQLETNEMESGFKFSNCVLGVLKIFREKAEIER